MATFTLVSLGSWYVLQVFVPLMEKIDTLCVKAHMSKANRGRTKEGGYNHGECTEKSEATSGGERVNKFII